MAKEYQKKGIGQELIAKTQDSLSSDVALLLLSAPNAMSYYPHIGFTQAHHAWLLPRQT
ncbi:GNAT family N-acetyltransferase [Caldalkalibacillus mannanilyticus]|uniref:GNAT family N-acetyltransferase n=1 Tax=Caldalkalibacillus mannanilyticus TaxID=1418 RepID=UPI003F726BFD